MINGNMLKTMVITLLSFFSVAAFAEQVEDISPAQLQQADTADWLILDVRTAEEFAAGHVPGAVNIPHTELPDRTAQIQAYKHKPVVLYCRSGYRAGKASDILSEQGFSQLKHLEGDMLGWQAAGLATQQ